MMAALQSVVIYWAQALHRDSVRSFSVGNSGENRHSRSTLNGVAQAQQRKDDQKHVLHAYNNSGKLKMSQERCQPIGEIELPMCSICSLQPIPESVQFVPFIMLEVFLAFISLKLSVAFLLCSYCFARNAWFCPQCKREVQVGHNVEGVSENLIIRMGNCMFMLSKNKFRVIATIVILYLLYSYAVDIHNRPKVNIDKTWTSLANNCGYQMFLENSYRANSMYAEYPQLGEWTITGIFLRENHEGGRLKKIAVKMDPSQFKNPMTEDIVVKITEQTEVRAQTMEMGDVVEIKGQWQGRQNNGHLFRFLANRIIKLGYKASPNDVKLLSSAQRFIRVHESELTAAIPREQHQQLLSDKTRRLSSS